ncbi:hypothetical protein HDC31_002639 [Microbacterium sp. JAI119]|nr:hypothetical protein [Microbacterium sp. JAI119]NYF29077.1 hypothetical protein [Microbacterium sp. JAI119]
MIGSTAVPSPIVLVAAASAPRNPYGEGRAAHPEWKCRVAIQALS